MESRIFAPTELDLATAPALEADIVAAIAADDANLVIDFSNLTFIDSTGLRVLVDARNALDEQGRALRVVNAPAQARRIFELTDLSDLLALDS